MTKVKFIIILISQIIFLSACQTTNTSTKSYELWQQPYPLICSNTFPLAPVCVNHSFETKSLFNACKTDVENYRAALLFQASCIESELDTYLSKLYEELENLMHCIEASRLDYGRDGFGNSCYYSLPNVPTSISSLVQWYPGPVIRTQISPRNLSGCDGAIQNESDYSKVVISCIMPLNDFLAVSANDRYQMILNELYGTNFSDGVIAERLNTVVKEFNCRARGEIYCF